MEKYFQKISRVSIFSLHIIISKWMKHIQTDSVISNNPLVPDVH